jgi:hypothetical protein
MAAALSARPGKSGLTSNFLSAAEDDSLGRFGRSSGRLFAGEVSDLGFGATGCSR